MIAEQLGHRSMSGPTLTLLLTEVGLAARHALERRLGSARLTLTQYRILRALADHGTMHIRLLARTLGESRQTTLVGSRRLADGGLVRRATEPGDARLVRLTITRAGLQTLADTETGICKLDEWLERRLRAHSRETLYLALTTVARSFVLERRTEPTWSD